MNETPDVGHETLDFALLPLGDKIVPAVPLRRMPQEAVIGLMLAPPGGHQFMAASQLLTTALCEQDVEAFLELDFGDAMNTIMAFLQTQVAEGYPAMSLDLDMELKDLFDE